MPEPLRSGRRWVEAFDETTPIEGATNLRWWVRPDDGSALRAMFKTPRPEFLPHAMYALGMERVAYELGDALGLPIPAVHLEPVDGTDGCLSIRAGGRNRLGFDWADARASRMTATIDNENLWSLGVVFDVWIANFDREPAHIILDPIPAESAPHDTNTCTSWLIDHEKSGLWWPTKISADAGIDVENLEEGDGSMLPEYDVLLRNRMPTRYLMSFQSLNDAARDPILENVRRVADDEIRVAVERVSEGYMSEREKALTIAFLTARRDRIDNLVRDVCALPQGR